MYTSVIFICVVCMMQFYGSCLHILYIYIYMCVCVCDKYSTVWRQILKFEIKKNNYTGGTQSEPPVKNGFSQAADKVSRL